MNPSAKKTTDIQNEITLKAISKKKVYEEIARQIQKLIDGGKLKHGDRLPPERVLAEAFQVSRHSVREAFRTLEEKGILKSRVGSGTYVVIEDEPSVVEFLAMAIKEERTKLVEIFQFRRILEPQIAALAAENRTAAELDEMDRIIDRQKMTGDDFSATADYDQAFHLTLAKASKNSILLNVVERLNDLLRASRVEITRAPGRLERSVKGHLKILEAIRAGLPDQAASAMEEHLDQVAELALSDPSRQRLSSKPEGARQRLISNFKVDTTNRRKGD